MYNASTHTDLTKFCSDEFVAVYYMIGSSQTVESILDTQSVRTGYEKIGNLVWDLSKCYIATSNKDYILFN